MARCPHVPDLSELPAPLDVCQTCIEIGTDWFHLRQCLVCGRTLCCDSSPERHMSRHARDVQHPVMRPVPDEGWTWCFADDTTVRPADDGTWVTYDAFLEAGLDAAAAHLAAGGAPDEDPELVTDEGFPLGAWFAHVAARRADGDLEPAERTALEAVGPLPGPPVPRRP